MVDVKLTGTQVAENTHDNAYGQAVLQDSMSAFMHDNRRCIERSSCLTTCRVWPSNTKTMAGKDFLALQYGQLDEAAEQDPPSHEL
jgi:Fe-S-cluster-containing dehydrogenase component